MELVRKLGSSKEKSLLAQRNARQAWNYWIKTLAPDDWLDVYWSVHNEPWKDARLTGAEQYALKYRNNEEFAIKERLRRQIKKAANCDGVGWLIRSTIARDGASNTLINIVGYSIDEFKKHFERMFHDGMDWEAFKRGEIHIDHIIPQSEFDLTNKEQWRKCWCLSNIQPLWARDNIAKSNKVISLL